MKKFDMIEIILKTVQINHDPINRDYLKNYFAEARLKSIDWNVNKFHMMF